MRKHLGLLTCGLLLTACGGGGGGSTPEPVDTAPLPLPVAPETVVRGILEDCFVSDLRRLLALFGELGTTLEAGAPLPQPTIALEAVDVVENRATVSVDLDVDGIDDLEATVRLRDGQGQPALSALEFALLALQVQGQDLAGALAALPDGTHALVAFETFLLPTAVGEVDFLVVGGAPTQASGVAEVDSGDCTTTFSFTDVPASAVLDAAPYPDLLVSYVLVSPEGTISGTIDLDGTNLATLTAVYLGLPYLYTLDLATGLLTPLSP